MNGNQHAGSTRPMGSTTARGPDGPSAPGRNDELMSGGSRTVFEFDGHAADGSDSRGSAGTFVGGTLDLSKEDESRESNLKSGSSGWILMGVAVLIVGGVVAWSSLGSNDKPSSKAVPVPAAMVEETKRVDPVTPIGVDGSNGAGAPTPAADPKPATDPQPAADPKPATDPQPPPKNNDSSEKPSTSKPSSEGGSTPKPKPSSGGGSKPKPKPSSGGGSKPRKLKPKKPPRDPLSGLPKPPGA